jgi:hypothetical protein
MEAFRKFHGREQDLKGSSTELHSFVKLWIAYLGIIAILGFGIGNL